MAGTGLDALMIRDADRALKDRFGRAAYVWTGAKHLRLPPFRAPIDVDGRRWFDGRAGCILVGNVRKVFGGIEAFDDASPEDGRLELGVVTAKGIAQWTRALVRTAAGSADQLEVRAHDEGAEDQGQARPQDAVRARRWRREAGRPSEDQGGTGGGHVCVPEEAS